MSALAFELLAPPDQRLDLSVLTPERLAGLSEGEIAALPVGMTRERVTVGEVFRIRMGDAAAIRIRGGSARFDRVGEGLAGGEVVVAGDVGHRAGRAMRGGRLVVEGSAGPQAGSGMSGGHLRIAGDAGDFLAGPLAGETAGMSGGTLHVGGRAGRRAGDRMRRGTILVEGDCGAEAGSRMIAGTIVVGGRAGPRPGTLMRRGTLVLLGGVEAGSGGDGLGPTFPDNGPADFVFLRLLGRVLAAPPFGWTGFPHGPTRRLGGDTASLGKGEVFLPL